MPDTVIAFFSGAMAEMDEIKRVAWDNPKWLVEFVRKNYPNKPR